MARHVAALLASAVTCAVALRASADVEVRAETVSQTWQFRGLAGAPVISTRRVTQFLSVAAVHRPSTRRGVTVSFRARVRIDAEFGETCDPVTNRCIDEANRDRVSEFVPLFARRSVDVPFAYVDIEGLGRGVLDVRAGRIFQNDALGFLLFDGARARVSPGLGFIAEVVGGLQTRGGFPLSTGRFEPDGVVRTDRIGWPSSTAPYVLPALLAPMVGIAVESPQLENVFARVAWRRVWTERGISDDRVGGSVDARVGRWRFFADGAFVIPSRELTTAIAGFDVRFGDGHRWGADYSRFRPAFDLTSIWSAFWTDGMDDLRTSALFRLGPRTSVGLSWLLRRYALSETGRSPNATDGSDLFNTGGSMTFETRAPAWRLAAHARGEGGAVGARGGVDIDGAYWVVANVLRLDGRLSFWYVADPLRPQRAGPSFAAVVGATARLGSLAELHLDLEDDVNAFVGQRFRLYAWLQVRAWL